VKTKHHIADNLDWWSTLLQSGGVSGLILPEEPSTNLLAFSDASSGIGLSIVIGDFWSAWHFILGWKTSNGKWDIGWAEAIAFRLLVYTLATFTDSSANFIIHRDNTGIVEGLWRHHHHNRAVNDVFRRIHKFINNLPRHFKITTTYIASALKSSR
jgi:hypothetical protein